MSVETLREFSCNSGRTLQVDRFQNTIHDVKVLGLTSRNNRTYTPECAAKATPLYEGVAVFVDHTRPGEARSYHDRIGKLEKVTARQGWASMRTSATTPSTL